MDMKDYDINFKEKRTNGYLIATLFIIVGILFLLRNLGMIDPSLFDLLVSWPMLLVVSGIFTIFHRNPVGGMAPRGRGSLFPFPAVKLDHERFFTCILAVRINPVRIGHHAEAERFYPHEKA